MFHPEEQQQKIGAANQHGMRIEPSIHNGYTRREINWQEDLETTVEYLPRPRQQGSLWVAHWFWLIPAEMTLFFTGPDNLPELTVPVHPQALLWSEIMTRTVCHSL